MNNTLAFTAILLVYYMCINDTSLLQTLLHARILREAFGQTVMLFGFLLWDSPRYFCNRNWSKKNTGVLFGLFRSV
jgi:hypothetical protein